MATSKISRVPSKAAVGAGRSRPNRIVQPRADSAATRTRILDCAEHLFAQHGFHGTSVRDIATLAEVQFALIGYHFGSKVDLLDAVVVRRIEVLNGERREFLALALAESGGKPIPLRHLLDGYIGCFVKRAAKADPGWRNYAQVIAALANNPEWSGLMAARFNEIAKIYLDELKRTLPGITQEALLHAFFFAIGATVAVCARPGRIETLSDGKFKSSNVSRLYDHLCVFLEGGFQRLAE